MSPNNALHSDGKLPRRRKHRARRTSSILRPNAFHPALPAAASGAFGQVRQRRCLYRLLSKEVTRLVPHAEYVEAFYTGGLFKLQRLLLGLFFSKSSTDVQARQLASGEIGNFAAWRVENRTTDQLLMCDIGGRTRSWLMVSASHEPTQSTRLYFGSAVVPVMSRSGKPSMGFLFKALLGFHKAYSRALLGSARSRLERIGH